ncbi:MAG: DUF2490 domain-containing protein [Cytophagales bacterium]|nr:DUF2490 domain-containing protein [Cytophagales bacterium]
MPTLFKYCILLAAISFGKTFGQTLPPKEVTTAEQSWIGYFNQARFSKRWGLATDVHYRRTGEFIQQNSFIFVRTGVTYYVTDDIRLLAGYAYLYLFGNNGITDRPEHRPWQQIWWKNTYPWFQSTQWIRLEQRFRQKIVNNELTEGYNFNYRIRYNMSIFIPLIGHKMAPKTPFFAIQDEIFLNFGQEIVYNYFDNNRFFVGLGYQFSKNLNAQLGYMNVFQQLSNGYQFNNAHVIRLYIYHNIDFRKEKD